MQSERLILQVEQPQSNHNGATITFGPDGYLYVGLGDGGNANDLGIGDVEDWYADDGGGNGQDVEQDLPGSILRLDVDRAGSGTPYAIPRDNPSVGRPAWRRSTPAASATRTTSRSTRGATAS